ncbi:uncharacterized protein DFL_009205 [Arthrobotrys flagrans]|uniref:Uncharacterized protein n=1 Tax=Arthrobotrys flagrans TaxID=97331 RepID=A0A436ZQZ8_ARTFL|nr:hypothetical protein DFL_009205 [Arthrobotrys flagrans]
MPKTAPQTPTRQPDENIPDSNDFPKESKPSLTILGHKLSEQVRDHIRGLSASMAGILESRNALSDIIKDVRGLVNSQHDNGKELVNVTERIQKAVTTHIAHSALILTTLEELKVLNINMETRLELYHAKVDAAVNLSNQALQDRRDMKQTTIEMNNKLDQVLEEFEKMKTTSKPRRTKSRKLAKPMGTIPSKPDDEEETVLSTAETTNDSNHTDEDTPQPPKKKPRKTQKKQVQKTGPSQATRSKSSSGTKSLPSAQRVPITRRSKRQRSISLGATVESKPGLLETANKPSCIVEETPGQGEPDALVEQQSGRIPETVVNSSKPEPKTAPQKQAKKRMLAGPATQEAWEMDGTTT